MEKDLTHLKSLNELDEQDARSGLAFSSRGSTTDSLDYAWKWFSYHADQRLTAFNYFLLIVGLLTTGYLTCVDKLLYAMQVVLGLVGVSISLAFSALDVRNEQLVGHGRAALRALERAINTPIHRADYDVGRMKVKLADLLVGDKASSKIASLPLIGFLARVRIPIRHTIWLRQIERLAILLFLAAIAHGLYFIITTRSLHGTTQQAPLYLRLMPSAPDQLSMCFSTGDTSNVDTATIYCL